MLSINFAECKQKQPVHTVVGHIKHLREQHGYVVSVLKQLDHARVHVLRVSILVQMNVQYIEEVGQIEQGINGRDYDEQLGVVVLVFYLFDELVLFGQLFD